MARFARNVYRLLRVAIILLPLLIAFRGFVFLRECFRMLAAPGTGVDLKYQARKGAVLHITAESYSYLWKSGTLHIIRPKLRDSAGEMLASAESARVTGIKLGDPEPIEGVVRDLRAKLVRLPTGRFALEEYLPEKTPETQNRPYSVRIAGVDVDYVDLSGKGRFSQRAISKEMLIEGMGEDFIASGRLTLPKLGIADTAVQRYKNAGLVIALSAQRLSLGRALNHFRTTPEGKNLDILNRVYADTIVANGPVRVFVPEKAPFLVASSLSATATNVVYNGADRFKTAVFNGLITGKGASGALSLDRGGSSAQFIGAADWSATPRFAGQVAAHVATRADIPPSVVKLVPRDLDFSNTSGHGWLSYDDRSGFRYDGDLQSSRLTVAGQSFQSVAGIARAGNGLVRLESVTGLWGGSPVQGTLAYFPTGQKLSGQLAARSVDLARVARLAGLKGLAGRADANALLSGTVSKPIAAIRAAGDLAFRAPGASKNLTGAFQGAAGYEGGGLTVSSLTLHTPTGELAATGHADPKGALALKVAARGVALSALAPSLGGSASFSGDLTGTTADPHLSGRAQVVGLKAGDQTLPVLVANVEANRRLVHATGVRAVRGAAQASGDLTYGLANGAIGGTLTATNLPVSELSDQLTGIVDIQKATLGGTLKSPVVNASLQTRGLVIAGRPIGRGRATVALNGNNFKVAEMRAQMAGGDITASASGNVKTKQTRIELSASGLSLTDLAPELAPTANLDGRVSGVAVLGAVGTDIRYGRASGTVSDVSINRTLVGGGSWTAAANPNAFTGSMQIGTLERYFDLSNLAINRKDKHVGADLTAYRIPLQDVYSAVQRYLPEPGSDLERRVRRIEGVADAQLSVSGTINEPNVKLTALDVTGLALEGRQLGAISAKLDKLGSLWNITQFNWEGEAGTLRSSGVVDERGDVQFDGDLTNFDLGLLSIVNDNLTRIRGRAGLAFSVAGPTHSPTVQASLDASRTSVLTGKDDKSPQLEFGLVLDTINISESTFGAAGTLAGGIQASGKLFYRGFEGNLSASVPLKYPLTLPEGQPLNVALDLPERGLETLSEYFPAIDASRTKGTVSGHLALGGVVGAAKLTGRLGAKATSVALNKVQTTLSEASAEATVNGEEVALNVAGTSSEGGTVAGKVTAPIGDVGERIKELSARGLDALMDRTVTGDLALNDFGIRYESEDGRLIGKANAALAMSGPIRSPLIEGNTTLNGVNTVLPSFEVAGGAPVVFVIDPRFNVKLALADTATVRSSLARLRIIGDGSLSGSLSAPTLNSDLTVMGGSVNLPNAQVRVEPGGTVRLRYRTGPGGDALASLDVDLRATSSLTALEYGDIPQHYDITLAIRGNLLDPTGNFITAESDPPGLSQQRILAMLGQADLIAALAGSVSRLEASRELRNVLAGYAVPALLSPITNAFARGLGLDYLTVDYNPFSKVSLSFAKEIGHNLTLQGRRQLSQPLPGYRPEFDLRLVYRPTFGGKSLKRTAFSFGVDQDRPWKFAVEYGFRF